VTLTSRAEPPRKLYHEGERADTAPVPERQAGNIRGHLAEKACMKALLRAREQTESDDDRDDDPQPADRYCPRPVLRMRCYACAGSGKQEILDPATRIGRIVRCIACRGTGRVTVG
jgi:hypothetical protein